MRTVLAAMLAFAATPAVAADAPLESLIDFSNTRWCATAPDLQVLLDSLLVPGRRGAESVYVLGEAKIPPAFAAQLGRPRFAEGPPHVFTATVPVRGTWRGLKVREVYSYAQPDTDHAGFGVRFEATAAQVRAAANAAGFALPSSGRRVESSELELVIQVRPERGGATLSCDT